MILIITIVYLIYYISNLQQTEKPTMEGLSPPWPLTFCLEYLRSLSYIIHFIINLQKYIFFRSIFPFGYFFLFFLGHHKEYCKSVSYTENMYESYRNVQIICAGMPPKVATNGLEVQSDMGFRAGYADVPDAAPVLRI